MLTNKHFLLYFCSLLPLKIGSFLQVWTKIIEIVHKIYFLCSPDERKASYTGLKQHQR